MVHKRKRQAFRQMEHWIGICTKTDTWHHIIQINEHVWKNLVRIVFSFVNTKLGALIISMYKEQSIITLKTTCMAILYFIRPPRAPWGPLDSGLMNENEMK